jgi:AraC-like DNA-binding protein
MDVDGWTSHFAERPDRRSRSLRFDLVQQAEILALASLDKPLHIGALCRRLAVSERTLRKAFMATHGLSPCRHLRMLRLRQARQVLITPHNRVVTVTETATRFGFAELGRFSVEYRKVFGESPSMTLRRTSRAHRGSEEARA